jgi:hypothetical protein
MCGGLAMFWAELCKKIKYAHVQYPVMVRTADHNESLFTLDWLLSAK